MSRFDGVGRLGKVSADFGFLQEPNVLRLSGSVEVLRFQSGSTEVVRSREANLFFDTSSLGALWKGGEVSRAELRDAVTVTVPPNILQTDYAEYFSHSGALISSRPVRVGGPGRVFRGSDGFYYDLGLEQLEIFGEVHGVVLPEAN